jgi:hypothetical protein
VIHFDEPSASAVRPSRLMASFTRTHGRPRWMRLKNPMLSSCAASRIKPTCTPISAARSFSMPAPATLSKGSSCAMTTRPTPAAIRASAQGGVRPKCAQGSSVT